MTLLVFTSCSSDPIVMRSAGTNAVLHLTDHNILRGELIGINDSSFFVLKDTLHEVRRSGISSVSLDIDESRGWMIDIIAAQAIPAIIFIADREEGFRAAGYTFLGVAALTWFLYESSGPETDFKIPGNLDNIRRYCRYPQPLSGEQIEMLKNLFRNNKRSLENANKH